MAKKKTTTKSGRQRRPTCAVCGRSFRPKAPNQVLCGRAACKRKHHADVARKRRAKKKPRRGKSGESIQALIAKAKRDPTSLTPAELKQLLGLKKLKDAGGLGGDAYRAHRARMADRARAESRAGRDIGPIPEPRHPGCRRRGLADFQYFLDHYFSGRFFLPWGVDHPDTIAKIQRCSERGEMFALAMPRGSGKTSLIECAALWVMLKGLARYIAVIAATSGKGIDILDSIKTELMTNQALYDDFPEVCFPIWQLEGINQRARTQLCQGRPTNMQWQARKLVLPTVARSKSSGAIFHVAGLQSGEILGLKHTISLDDGRTTVIRPQFVIVDDPQTPESARSPAQCQKRGRILTSSVLGMAGPRSSMTVFALVTVIEADDLADSLLNRELHPEWQGERLKAMYHEPTNAKLWEKYASILAEARRDGRGIAPATEFYLEHRKAMDRGAVVAWPDRYDPEEASGIQHCMTRKLTDERMFQSEYQNDPIVEHEQSDLLSADEIAAKLSGYAQGIIPASCEKLTAFVDCHDKLLYYAVVAWTDDFTGYVVDYGTYPRQRSQYFALRNVRTTLKVKHQGAGREGAILAGLNAVAGEVLDRPWKRDDGATIRVARCLVDAGYVADVVKEFVRTTGSAVPFTPSFGRSIGASRRPMREYQKKRGEKLTPHWYMPAAKKGEGGIRHVLTDVNHWKTFVHARLVVAIGDKGSLSFFGKDPRRHRLIADHLLAEYPVRVTGPYGTVDEWKHPPDQPDNHWLDCIVGCAAAASMEGAVLPGVEPKRKKKRKVSLAELQRRARA